ncbi:NAD-dependent epimerase/dehydratase family protein [Erythrobacter rubeus]|uniref:NAD(P)-dependent oxidoreductase n=1 Tax=Erythrobacter rubeus TaxID=2760803 RepID=A0ABR8KL17_9SPHN|nr:NAD(P)-dependent oxidoreductase [Erythrobacter rubeus]MBD2841000.1 NAD(P)-dependent oxidoreductase [Erythrobacter rubeus]
MAIRNDLVMVTGASGFIGRALVDQLHRQGAAIIALGSAPKGAPLEGVEWRSVDLLDDAAARTLFAEYRPNTLIHAAWARAQSGGLWHLEENWTWRDASLRLFREFWDQTGGHIVACGTCAEYDPPADGNCIEGSTPIAPSSIYGQAKAELAEKAFREAEEAGGMLTWARLFYLFGPYEAPARLVPQIIDSLLAGEPAKTGSGKAVRDFGFTRDIAGALTALAAHRCAGAFNVGTGTGVSIRLLATRIAALCEKEDLLRIGALADRPGEAPRIVADVNKVRAATDWLPDYDLEAALKETIRWRSQELNA